MSGELEKACQKADIDAIKKACREADIDAIKGLVDKGVPLTDPEIILCVVKEREQEKEYDEKENPTYKPVNPRDPKTIIDIIAFLGKNGVEVTDADLNFVRKEYDDLKDCVRDDSNVIRSYNEGGHDVDEYFCYEIERMKDRIVAHKNYYAVMCYIRKLFSVKSEDATPVKRERDPGEEHSVPSDRVAKKQA